MNHDNNTSHWNQMSMQIIPYKCKPIIHTQPHHEERTDDKNMLTDESLHHAQIEQSSPLPFPVHLCSHPSMNENMISPVCKQFFNTLTKQFNLYEG